MKDHPFRAQLNVIPLAAGFRHLPRVQLYRYVGDQKQHNEDDEGRLVVTDAKVASGHKGD